MTGASLLAVSAVMWAAPARVEAWEFGPGGTASPVPTGAPTAARLPTQLPVSPAGAAGPAPTAEPAPAPAPTLTAEIRSVAEPVRSAQARPVVASVSVAPPAPVVPSVSVAPPAPVVPSVSVAPPAPVVPSVPDVVRRAPPREVRLTLGAAIPLTPVGVLPGGELQLPDDPAWGGWWTGGSLPGDPVGPVVLAGHVDARASGPGAFAALLDVVAGATVDLVLSDGGVVSYTVTSREELSKAALPAGIFAVTGDARLVLVTCGGDFDPVTRHYADNVIVTAVPA